MCRVQSGFPTIKFFREGEVRSYNGARTVDALVSFGKEMAGPATSAITSAAEFSQLADKHPVSIVFVGGKGGAERVSASDTRSSVGSDRHSSVLTFF